ncbi:MAG: DNA repair protein RecN [Actinobacteria bacterium]|nr:DNA repair protein RecN [Actinomycetota bacterium]
MLVELRVQELGVIADLHLVFGPGMTAVTGETGAGKTLVVDAIELLVGGRADPSLVRTGANEATIEGRFEADGAEVVLRRVVPTNGRSRAYIDGAMATVGELSERGAALVDLHGQHAHQSLLASAAQRGALDAFGAIDLSLWRQARNEVGALDERLRELGGDPRGRARELDLLAFQVDEIDNAQLDSPEEERALEAVEEHLANAVAHREAAATAYGLLNDEDGATDRLRAALGAITNRSPFDEVGERLRSGLAELDDVAGELRDAAETIDDDPEELARVRARRQLFVELRRKYGESLNDVIRYGEQARRRLEMLRGYEAEVERLRRVRDDAVAAERVAAEAIAQARHEHAPAASAAVQTHLRELALPRATVEISVNGDAPADDVAFLFAANPGEPALALRKVASGGELARVMLALRLVLTEGPPTMVFDEVDAGIGGEAAVAVGQALARLSDERQVLVVTHLPQVAAFADAQVQVLKADAGDRVIAQAEKLTDADRVVELSRMLAGDADSAAARRHAKELLAAGRKRRAG